MRAGSYRRLARYLSGREVIELGDVNIGSAACWSQQPDFCFAPIQRPLLVVCLLLGAAAAVEAIPALAAEGG